MIEVVAIAINISRVGKVFHSKDTDVVYRFGNYVRSLLCRVAVPNLRQGSNMLYSKKSFGKHFSFTQGIPDKVSLLQKAWRKLPPFKLFPDRSAVIGYVDSEVYIAITDSTLFKPMNEHKEVCLKAFHDSVSFIVVGIRFRTHVDVPGLLSEFDKLGVSATDKGLSYREYIVSPEWRRRSAIKKKSVNHSCQVCNSSKDLQVHHRTYKNMGNERDNDLTVLCKPCHTMFHTSRELYDT